VLTLLLFATLGFTEQTGQAAGPPTATGRITGTIVEARTNTPLPAVLVKVQSTGQQVFSDADGRFEIVDVPLGSQTLTISVVGYGLVRRELIVSATDVVDVTITVNEGASTYVEEVSVGADRFRESEPGVGTQSVLGSRELLALRGLIADDPFRAVQVLPGVSTGDDFRAEFALRGLGPEHIGISIDGIDSPLLFHTVRGIEETGSLGLINSDILESASLLAGPHPQRLNSHLGSRVDFTTRDGSRDRLTVRAMVSASAASTVWEGPIGSEKNASWLVAARRSYIDWLLRQIDSTTGATFGFTDAQMKFTFDLSPKSALRASMIAGRSVLRDEEETPGPNSLDRAANATLVGNLQWRFTPSATFSTTQQVYVLDSDYDNRVVDGRAREEGGDRDITWRGSAQWNPASRHLIEFGAQAQSLHARRVDRRFTTTTETVLVDATGDSWSAAGWAQYRWMPNARMTITPGVRIERWQSSTMSDVEGYDQAATSPWLLTDFEVRAGTRVKLSAGIQHQAATLDNAIYTLPGQPLVPERAAVVEGAIEQRIGSNWRLNLSAYHRRDADRLRQVNSEVRIENNRVVLPMDPYWANVLSGDTNGVEVVLERRAVSGLNGWVSYAWSDSRLEDSARGESFPADYDQRHTVNAYVGFRWGGKTNFSARYRFGSNFPMTGYIGEDPNGYVLTSQRNGLRLPEYARLDLRADRAFTYRRSRLTLFIEVVNATNRDNYRYESPGINFTTRRVFGPLESLFPLLPVAGVLVEF
jgi:hypothetical protein